jgi:hypothetical protein
MTTQSNHQHMPPFFAVPRRNEVKENAITNARFTVLSYVSQSASSFRLVLTINGRGIHVSTLNCSVRFTL